MHSTTPMVNQTPQRSLVFQTPNNVCTVSSNGYVDWLNTSPSCTFPTGVTFWSHVDQGYVEPTLLHP